MPALARAVDRLRKGIPIYVTETGYHTSYNRYHRYFVSERQQAAWVDQTFRQAARFPRVQLTLINMAEAHTYLGEEESAIALLDEARALQPRSGAPGNVVLAAMGREPLKTLLLEKIHDLYQQKEIEFPITVAMARFMSEATRQLGGPGARYDREGLLRWYQARYAGVEPAITEEDFRTLSRSKLQQMLVEVSREQTS